MVLAPGDTALLYTDGVTEAMNRDDEEFGVERLKTTFSQAPPTDPRQANDEVFRAVHEFVGDTLQSDDITCLTLHRSGTG